MKKEKVIKGVALLITLVFVLILGIGAVAIARLHSTEISLVRRQNNSTKAFYLAEAGIELAIWELNGGGNWTNWKKTGTTYTFPDVAGTGGLSTGDIDISITNATSSTPQVDAIGYAPSKISPEGKRHVSAKLEKPVSPAFDYCIATGEDLTLEDNTSGVVGDVHSNGDIVNIGVGVTGAGTAGGTITIETIEGEGGFSDGYEDELGEAGEITIPTLDDDDMLVYLGKADETHDSDWTVPDGYDISGNIIYVTGNVMVDAVTVNGPGTIVATGKILIQEGAVVGSASGMVGLFTNYTSVGEHDEAVKIEKGSDCYVAIFAPNGEAKIEGPEDTHSYVYGSIVANIAKLETGSHLEYPEGPIDITLPGSTTFSISSWSEQ